MGLIISSSEKLQFQLRKERMSLELLIHQPRFLRSGLGAVCPPENSPDVCVAIVGGCQEPRPESPLGSA